MRLADITGPDTACQAIWCVVRQCDYLIWIIKRHGRDDGSEDFFLNHRHFRSDTGQNSWFVKVALAVAKLAAAQDFGPIPNPGLH